ncbi:MAG: hypothetical protein M0Q46_05835 [Endomicrobiales bacterium]|nr:hypothetical protein [Endomicrobiales bacterium]
MINRFIIQVICFCVVFSSFGFAAQNDVKSSEVYSASVSSSAPDALEAKDEQINNAISTLNYKLELVQSRYVLLSNQVDELSKRKVSLQNENQNYEPTSIADLQSELKLVRSDLALVREDASIAKVNLNGERNDENNSESNNKWYESKWVAPCALAVSVIALLVAVVR